MCDSYVKLMKSQETYLLQKNYPNAFLLLSFIVRLIRQNDDPNLDLKSGEMFISDYRDSGIDSRKKYRNALEKLMQLGHISVIEAITCKNLGAKQGAKRGTKVKVLTSEVYNTFQNNEGQARGQIGAKQGPSSGPSQGPSTLSRENEDEGPSKGPSEGPIINKKEYPKKERKDKRMRVAFGFSSFEEKNFIKMQDRELVKITQEQYDSLANNPEVGKEMLEEMLDILEAYKGSTGKEYFSDFHVMKKGGWVRKKYEEQKNKEKKQPISMREKVLEKFKNGDLSNGYECFITEEAIAFTCLNGPTHYQLPFRVSGFEDQLQNILFKIRWKQKLEAYK